MTPLQLSRFKILLDEYFCVPAENCLKPEELPTSLAERHRVYHLSFDAVNNWYATPANPWFVVVYYPYEGKKVIRMALVELFEPPLPEEYEFGEVHTDYSGAGFGNQLFDLMMKKARIDTEVMLRRIKLRALIS